jgi:hypothetical protein
MTSRAGPASGVARDCSGVRQQLDGHAVRGPRPSADGVGHVQEPVSRRCFGVCPEALSVKMAWVDRPSVESLAADQAVPLEALDQVWQPGQ